MAEVKETDRKSGIMSLYESESVELKEVYTPEVKKEVVAFANTNGGTIYIGVQDNGVIIGLKPFGVYVRSGTASAPASEDAIRMMIKMIDGESFENNKSFVQDLTFASLNREMELRQLEC